MNRCSALRESRLERMYAEDIQRDRAYQEVAREREFTQRRLRERALRQARLERMRAEDLDRNRVYRAAQRGC